MLLSASSDLLSDLITESQSIFTVGQSALLAFHFISRKNTECVFTVEVECDDSIVSTLLV